MSGGSVGEGVGRGSRSSRRPGRLRGLVGRVSPVVAAVWARLGVAALAPGSSVGGNWLGATEAPGATDTHAIAMMLTEINHNSA